MSTNLNCEFCGGSDYYAESGFYFCNECHAQSQEVVAEVVNQEEAYVYGRSRSVKSSASTSSLVSVSKGHDWTTWEGYNFILKGLVDELITAGAPPQLKLVVLQLWVIFLKKSSVAFISKHYLPKLGCNYHHRDMQVIYGVVDKKRKCRKVKEDAPILDSDVSDGENRSVSSVSVKRGRIKKALAKESYDSSCIDNVDDVLSVLDLDSSSQSLPLSSRSRKRASSRSKMFSAKARREQKVKKSRRLNKNLDRTDYKGRQRDPTYVSRSKLLAILYLGLRLTGSNIFLGDMMRWISEGVLSYYEVSHLFPACVKTIDSSIYGLFPRTVSHGTVRKMTAEMAKLLGFNALPMPDILSLAARYIEELQLPHGVLVCVTNLFDMYKSKMEFGPTCAEVPNYEARAMAFIIVVLKLLFGLDGITERKISETAAEFNMYLDSETPKLFVWNDWVKYVECRKAFISLFHFPTKDAVFRDSYEGIELYIEDLKSLRQKDENGNKKLFMNNDRINPSVTSVMERPLQKLAALEPSRTSTIRFEPSLTPHTSYLETIKEQYSKGLDYKVQCHKLLKQNFKDTSLKFLLKPCRFIKMARAKGMKVKLCEGIAQSKIKRVKVKAKKETNMLLRAFLREEPEDGGVTSSGQVAHCSDSEDSAASENLRNGGPEHPSGHSDSADGDVDDGVEYVFLNHGTSRKRKHSGNREARGPENSRKTQETERGSCFRGNCKIGSTFQPEAAPPGHPRKCFRIYTPSAQYWFLGFPPRRFFNPDMFSSSVIPRFSSSFRWLLSECASLLHMSEQDLYSEVVLVETLHGYVLTPDSEANNRDNVSHFLKYVNTQW